MANMDRIGKHATTVHTEDGITVVTYHQTDVVEFDADLIALNRGRWKTVTTKTRMNQASNQFELGYTVYQKDYKWFVWLRDIDQDLPFTSERIVFPRVRTGKLVETRKGGWILSSVWANSENGQAS